MSTALTTIEVEAFKNFAVATALDLRALPPGLYFVRGRNLTNDRLGANGAGKTSFFSDAVTWCLYGRTVGGLRTTDVRSWLTKKPPRVAITLGRKVVQRGPHATELTVDGRPVGQEDVDTLVGLSFPAWAQAVVWGQGQPLFFDLAPRDKMALLSDALGLERWERRAEAAGARARRLEAALATAEGELRGLETAREHAQAALGAARDASERWGQEQAALIENNASALAAGRARAESLRGRRDEAGMAADAAGLAAREAREEIEQAQATLDEASLAARDREAVQQARAIELEEVMTQLRAFAAYKCPTCGQGVEKKAAARHAAALTTRGDELQRLLDARRKEVTTANRKIAELTATLDKAERALGEIEGTEDRAGAEQRSLDRELATAQAEAAAAERALSEARDATNPHRNAAADARARLKQVEKDAAEKTERAAKLAASIERAQFWAKGFRDIRLMVVGEILEDLRETTAAVLEALGLGEWSADYATERATQKGTAQQGLTVTIRSPAAGEGEVRWEAYSGGERQRLRLAGALALSEVLLAHAGASLDFRVLDEPTRGLSAEGARDLTEMLADYAEEAELRLFYIDHLAREGSAFARTITVVNEAGGARLET